MSYTRIVVAISDALGRQHLDAASIERPDSSVIAAEIIASQGNMPDYLRTPMRLLTWVFDWSGLFHGGRRFCKLESAHQLALINAWRNSSIGLCRNFVRFYESLFLLIALQEDVS
jgi:hypothetical protein